MTKGKEAIRSAQQGSAQAQYNLGVMYAKGEGVEKDHGLAVYWFHKAAEQGYARAQYYLGVAYANGQGIPKDHDAATYWKNKAAEQGLVEAQRNTELIGVKVKDTARKPPMTRKIFSVIEIIKNWDFQKIILFVGGVSSIIAVLFPPWLFEVDNQNIDCGYHFLIGPTYFAKPLLCMINIRLLFTELLAIGFVSIICYLFFRMFSKK